MEAVRLRKSSEHKAALILLELGRKGEPGDGAIRGIGQPPDEFARPLSNIWGCESFSHVQGMYGWPQFQRTDRFPVYSRIELLHMDHIDHMNTRLSYTQLAEPSQYACLA